MWWRFWNLISGNVRTCLLYKLVVNTLPTDAMAIQGITSAGTVFTQFAILITQVEIKKKIKWVKPSVLLYDKTDICVCGWDTLCMLYIYSFSLLLSSVIWLLLYNDALCKTVVSPLLMHWRCCHLFTKPWMGDVALIMPFLHYISAIIILLNNSDSIRYIVPRRQ